VIHPAHAHQHFVTQHWLEASSPPRPTRAEEVSPAHKSMMMFPSHQRHQLIVVVLFMAIQTTPSWQ
jgi:hypothetical protein